MAEDIVAVVMAGGMGERLRPLTDVRAKPAVPFGGMYRIIAFTLSNCINSDIRKMLVLTQYKSHSLSHHLRTGWGFLSRRLDQYLDEIPAQMQLGNRWYKGTADAIRQNMLFIDEANQKRVLILSGDHIYKMDYRAMRRFHDDHQGKLTLAVVRVPVDEARGAFGVLEVDENYRVVGFEEKPAEPKTLPGTNQCLASMGIYLFDTPTLRENLENEYDDFGKHIIPMMIKAGDPIYAWDFSTRNAIAEWEYMAKDGKRERILVQRASDSDYWRDVGTLDALWAANLDLVSAAPKFNLYGQNWPCFNSPSHFPPAKFVHEAPGRIGAALNSLVADGVIISGGTVRRSILSPGVYVHSYALIESSVLMGGDVRGGILKECSIGRHSKIRNAIIDKNVRISEGTVIGYDRNEDERRGLKTQTIAGTHDYVVVVPKDAHI